MFSLFLSFSKLLLGWLLVIVGFAGLFLPLLQGVLFLLLGVTLLSSESRWVRRRLDHLRKYFPRQVAFVRALRLKLHRAFKRPKRSAG
jgi:uncharacterized membrane protein YbaN (DUF454 family)